MSMEKITEEKRVAVYAECKRVCPNYDDTHNLSGGFYLQALSHGWGIYEVRKDRDCPKFLEPLWNYLTPEDTTVQLFYCLLGLAERDAVETDRVKVTELEKQNRKLQWLLDGEISAGEQRTAMQIIPIMREAAKDELIDKLQANSAALVEALEEIKKVHGFAYTYGDGFSNVTDKRLNSTGVAIEKVIEAHKKGGVQG